MKNLTFTFVQASQMVFLMFVAVQVQAASLIPVGSLTTALADIGDTGTDVFGLIIPVMVTIAALLIGVKLIKRFLNRI